MEKVLETEEICNFSISSLVVSTFAIQWSSDNHISLVTEKGVFIFELKPAPTSIQTQLKLSRTFIYPPDTLPAQAFAQQIDSLMWKLHLHDICSLLLDIRLTPKADEVTDAIPKITAVAWSPNGLLCPSKCLITVISSVGAIEILHKSSMNWYSLCDLSKCWLNVIQEEIQHNLLSCKDISTTCSVIKKNIERLLCRAMAWSTMYKLNQESFAYLVTAYSSSELVIWKFSQIVNPEESVSPKISHQLSLDRNAKVNVLHWINVRCNEYLIVIGYFDGQVHGIRYQSTDQFLENTSIDKYYTYSDKIPVTSLHLVNQSIDGFKILISKGHILLLLSLSPTCVMKDIQRLCVAESAISGITIVNNHSILVTTQDSSIFMINIKNDQFSNIQVKPFVLKQRLQYLGLCMSPMHSMFLGVTSPHCLYDHLVIREPNTIHVFALKGKEWDPLHIINKSKNVSLEYLWECLEVLRVKIAKTDIPVECLPSVKEDLESIPLHDLRICMWSSVIKEVHINQKEVPNILDFASKVSDARSLVFLRSAAEHLIHLSKRTNLTKDQELSVTFLRMYLEVYLAGEEDEEETDISRFVKSAMEATSHMDTGKVEKCVFCDVPIGDVPWNVTKCPAGHVLPRCARTFLQISNIQYRSCSVCKQIFHPSLDAIYDEVRCMYCDLPALYDGRVLNVKGKSAYAKNLSKQRLNIIETVKYQDGNVAAKKKNQTKIQKYSVVEDELYRLTETWEEL